MKKRYYKGVAVILTAAVALSTPLAAGTGTVQAETVQLPDPAYVYDFEGDTPLQSTGTQTGAESVITPVVDGGVVEVVQDGEKNHALRVSDGGVKSFGKNYAKLPTGIFQGVTGESGLTVSMRVNIDAEKNKQDAAAIFYSTPTKYNEWNLLRTKANLVTGVNAGTPQVWGDTPEAKKTKEHFGSWHTVTVTLDKEQVKVYLDGIEQTSSAPTGGTKDNGFVPALEKFATNQFHALGCGGFPATGGTSAEDMSELLYDDIKIYTTALTAEQVYSSVTGGDVVNTDKTALETAIREAQKLGRFELYTESTAAGLKQKLEAAVAVNADPGAEQEAVDAAKEDLLTAMKNLQKKETDLSSGLLLNTDFTEDTSVVSEDKKTVTSGGYAITPMGNSVLTADGIQSSTDGAKGMAGISLDKDLLNSAALEKGLTFNIRWNFSTVYKENGADFWDLFAVTGADGNVLMKHTVGFITAYADQESGSLTRLYPNPDCKNGFVWDSCKKYETGKVKNLTFTIDQNGCRSYVDGVLACEKKDLSGIDFSRIISEAADITVGRDSEGNHGDLMGTLHGVQVYGRALNEAEVDQLAAEGVPGNETTCSAVITARKDSQVVLASGNAVAATVKAGADGRVVLKGLKKGQQYSYTITHDSYTDVTGTLTAGTDAEKDVTGSQEEKPGTGDNDPDKKPGDNTGDKPDHKPGDNQGNNQGGNPGNNTGNSQASLQLGKTDITVYTGKKKNKETIQATVTGASKSVVWTSSNKKVASVSNGTVKAVNKGTAVITAKANGIAKTVRVTVKNPSLKVKKGKKTVSKIKVKKRKTVKLSVTVTPTGSGISLAKLTGKSKKIAKVSLKKSKLTIRGKKKGKITLKVKSGKAVKKIKVTVR